MTTPAKSEKDRVVIFDTTLRDGEQSPGATMTHEEKLEVAELLDDMGVDVIEAGFPIASEGDFAAVQAIAAAIRRPIIAGLARLHLDVEMLDLLPPHVPAVQGLKIYQSHFTDARELIVTVRAPDREAAERTARSIADHLQRATNRGADQALAGAALVHGGLLLLISP